MVATNLIILQNSIRATLEDFGTFTKLVGVDFDNLQDVVAEQDVLLGGDKGIQDAWGFPSI